MRSQIPGGHVRRRKFDRISTAEISQSDISRYSVEFGKFQLKGEFMCLPFAAIARIRAEFAKCFATRSSLL